MNQGFCQVLAIDFLLSVGRWVSENIDFDVDVRVNVFEVSQLFLNGDRQQPQKSQSYRL